MIVTIFEWTVLPDCEEVFIAAWNEGTTLLLREGSLGSALFQSADGHFHAVARWPDRDVRDAAFAKTAGAPVFVRMRGCVGSTLRREDVDEIANFWRVA